MFKRDPDPPGSVINGSERNLNPDQVLTVGEEEENEGLVEGLRHVHPEAVGFVYRLQPEQINK